MDTEVQKTSPAFQKFSRYRSVRVAAAKEVPVALVPGVPVNSPTNNAVNRTLSRYRNARLVGQSAKPLQQTSPGVRQERLPSSQNFEAREPTPIEQITALHQQSGQIESNVTSFLFDTQYSAKTESSSCQFPASAVDQALSKVVDATLTKQTTCTIPIASISRMNYNDAQREAFAILNGEADRQKKSRQAQRDGGERKDHLAAKFAREHRTKTKTDRAYRHREAGEVQIGHDARKVQIKTQWHEKSVLIPVGAGRHSNVPGIDAPVSAINTGERIVKVKHNKISIKLPVNSSTTVNDLLQAATTSLPGSFNIESATLLECFKQLGIERPLRKYEHVRDVLNSWDQDDQNSLLIVTFFTGVSASDQEVACISNKQPGEVSVNMYHSQKPGVWDKRQITLRGDGQILLTKENGEKRNICHMSDFDVYIPTHHQMKKLNPPKKLCCAIKSQQKSAMFLSTANFVHFFATKDEEIAEMWYKAVQKWRSWYLVQVMGNGKNKANIIPGPGHGVGRVGTYQGDGSDIETPRSTTNQNTLNSNSIQKQAMHPSVQDITGSTSSPPPFRRHAAPPVSFPKNSASPSTACATESSYLASAAQSRHSPRSAENVPIMTSGSVPGQQKETSQSHVPAPGTHGTVTGLARSTSQPYKRLPPIKPLVDLIPHYQEYPQLNKKSRGITISTTPRGGLVDIATSPEIAVPLPPTTTFRSPGTGHNLQSGIQRTATQRLTTSHAFPSSSSPEDSEAAFLAGGLIAQADLRQGTRKRGKVTGDRGAQTPMLNVAEASVYVPGSLLAGVERQAGGNVGPVIDREKKREVVTSTGEWR